MTTRLTPFLLVGAVVVALSLLLARDALFEAEPEFAPRQVAHESEEASSARRDAGTPGLIPAAQADDAARIVGEATEAEETRGQVVRVLGPDGAPMSGVAVGVLADWTGRSVRPG